LEIGEVQGAMSSLAIAIAGIATVIIAPIVMGMIA
jgi:putative effector of murein hydrolase